MTERAGLPDGRGTEPVLRADLGVSDTGRGVGGLPG